MSKSSDDVSVGRGDLPSSASSTEDDELSQSMGATHEVRIFFSFSFLQEHVSYNALREANALSQAALLVDVGGRNVTKGSPAVRHMISHDGPFAKIYTGQNCEEQGLQCMWATKIARSRSLSHLHAEQTGTSEAGRLVAASLRNLMTSDTLGYSERKPPKTEYPVVISIEVDSDKEVDQSASNTNNIRQPATGGEDGASKYVFHCLFNFRRS